MMLTTPIFLLLALMQLLIGLAILFESRRSKQTHQKIFVALLATLFLWTISTTILSYVDTHARAATLTYFMTVNKLGFSLGVLVLVLMYTFNVFYPVQQKLTLFKKAIIGLGVALSLTAAFPFISGEFKLDGGLHYQYGSALWIMMAYVAVVLIAVARDNAILLRRSDAKLRQQAATLLVGLILTVVHALLFIVVLPSVFSTNSAFYNVGYLAPYFYTSFTAYGLLRQGLFNVRAVVARSVGYVLATIVLVGSYGLAIAVLSRILLGKTVDIAELIIFSSIGIIAAITYAPLLQWFKKITDRIFYRDAYDAQTLIDELNKIFVSTIHIDELLHKSATLIATTLRTEICIFTIKSVKGHITIGEGTGFHESEVKSLHAHLDAMPDSVIIVADLENKAAKKTLVAHNISAILRLIDVKHDNEVMGYVLLGDKKSGSIYTLQDIRVLEIIANEMVIAAQNALRFQEIEEFNKTLQQKITEKTRSLQHANDKLRKMDQTKDDFISMASHQLRTPLTSVKGYVSMVLDGDVGALNRKQRDYLSQVFVSSQRMSYLISDLLNVSRLRTGKFIIDRNPCNLATVVHEEVSQLVETAKSRNLTLIYRQPEHFPTLMLDEMKMRQVIMNFIDNAIYYTPSDGSITVTLADNPQSIEFTVADTGIGVPKSEQHHLFSKFFRAQNARVARPDGTGLGLFMAKKVITVQGGAIIFRSREGKGSTFGFTMPKATVGMAHPDDEK
jgi:signal transduction histidine kinase/uncharacterized membrane protein YidH (DUF202 family)